MKVFEIVCKTTFKLGESTAFVNALCMFCEIHWNNK